MMNTIRQGFSWWCFADRGVDAESLLAGAARLGYEAVDLVDESLWPLVRKHGLGIGAVGGHAMGCGLNRRENAAPIEAEVRANLAKAQTWNIPVLICFTGNRDGQDDETGLEICAESLSKLAPLAADAGVTLALELLNSKVDHPDYQGDHTSFGVRLCQAVGSPAVKILYDIYHMQIMGGDLIRTIEEYHPWFCHYHTAGNPGRSQPDTTQEINYPAIYRAIAATGGNRIIAHEFLPAADPLEALTQAFRDGSTALGSR